LSESPSNTWAPVDNEDNSLFTVYPDPQTGLIDKKKFLSTFSAYKVIYLPQILSHCKPNTSHTSTGDEHGIFDNGESKSKKDATVNANADDAVGGGGTRSTKAPFTWRYIYDIFTSLNEKDKSSWTEEKYKNTKTVSQSEDQEQSPTQDLVVEPGAFLYPTNEEAIDKVSSSIPRERGYSSFIVQHDKEAMDQLLQSLPLTQLPVNNYFDHETKRKDASEDKESVCTSTTTSTEKMKMKHGPCIWLFYGRNNMQEPLDGRPEHTDSISHDGTWHYQLSGLKEWHLKPTEDLIKQMQSNALIGEEEMSFWNNEKNDVTNDGTELLCNASVEPETDSKGVPHQSQRRGVTICCQEGDVLLVNTRLWWHSTKIPQQPIDKSKDGHVPSVSYARDLYLTWEENDGDGNDDDIVDDEGNMTNLDGLYASNDIEAGTIIFTEEDMPDCELHRTKDNPNCEVIEMENGSGAIVSRRKITAGEFFCVLETDDEDNDEGESGDEFEEDIESE